ncbi:MAG: MXAN_5187 C-terminal domain-containing protein [Thermoanaerobaculia bacterium]
MGISIERELAFLDRNITALRVEYERFFGGELRRPPVQSRRTIEDVLRRAGNAEVEKAAERFRLQSLQSRYNSFVEIWDRRMRAKEEGTTGPVRRLATGAVAPSLEATPAAKKPATKKTDTAAEVAALLAAAEAAVARTQPPAPAAPAPDAPAAPSVKPRSRVDFTPLFERYVAARQALGEDVTKLRYEKFEETVRRQAEEIRQRTGSSRLVFEVQTAEGRVKLVGRPVPAPGSKG